MVKEQFNKIEERDQAYFCCKFNRKEGDIRCCAHIYNIAIQAGKLYTLLTRNLLLVYC